MALRVRIPPGWSLGQTAPSLCMVVAGFVGLALVFGGVAALLTSCGALMIN